MKIRFITLLMALSIVAYAQTNPLSKGTPKQVGMSGSILAKIDDHVKRYMDDNKLPGGSFLVAKAGKVVYDKSFGFRSSKNEKAYGEGDIWRLASMTKAVTSVSIMQLFERGQIDLDDPVHKYIPAFKDQVVLDEFNPADSSFTTVPVEKAVTIRNLLTHTSGIVYGSFNPGKLMAVYEKFDMNVGFSHETWSTEEWINRLAKVPLAHQPGANFSYGLSMDVLGRIIEVVSGTTLDKYFKTNIFDPLGMQDTYFYLPEDKFDRLVGVYANVGGKWMTTEEMGMTAGTAYPKLGPRNVFAGGAGLSSTAMDYATFINTLVLGGGNILGKDALTEMSSDQMPEVITDYKPAIAQRTGSSFGLGFTVYLDSPTKRSPKSPGTYEWGGYFNTKFFIDPEEQLIFVGMTQIAGFNSNAFWEDMYKIIYESIDD
ncbi:serine hydrolase domain-containing protein [Roseivirga sp.]|uniref:serine hydrolase domain-containing protein n=1 Tax=Roseivirga sp. TaxID=1964215 RepID=UPI003B8E8444